MEQLKILVDLIKDLPAVALWVLAGFFIYKTLIVGSIYGVIRFICEKLFDYLKTKKSEAQTVYTIKTGDIEIHAISHDGTFERLLYQLQRLKDDRSKYIHSSGVDALKAALDKHFIEKDLNKKD